MPSKRSYLVFTITIIFLSAGIINFSTAQTPTLNRPKLVVGIVVDQMRWDYLYRYYDRYKEGGFKRLLGEGFTCENTFISYLPSFTAVGHSTIFTGSVPAIHGITGNDFVDQLSGKSIYCTEDSSVQSVGCNNTAGKMSPRNLLASTMTDELRLATNYQSKVVGISLKDRASILPAGHSANAAFWFDDASGNFITSTYYMKDLPEWVKQFNNSNEPAKLLAGGWNTLYPINTYTQSSEDNVAWEGTFPGETIPVFPHDMARIYKESRVSFRSTPYGNTLTADFAKAAIDGYKLGTGKATDFLTVNFASADYVGHMYGPNSIEVEDTYLRLDKELTTFFRYLDQKVGEGNYLIFLTADHGAANSIKYMQAHGVTSNVLSVRTLMIKLNEVLKSKFSVDTLVRSGTNYHVNFNINKIEQQHLNYDSVKNVSVEWLQRQPGVQNAVDIAHIGESPMVEPVKTMIINGYNLKRTGAVVIIPEPGWFEGSEKGTTHGSWNPYDTHLPLIFMGWNIKHGSTNTVVNMTDIAPTVSALLHIQVPDGCVGKPIVEVMK
jgi:predicted AlkP superfamily pyrophosphatase or phosphodiesterase